MRAHARAGCEHARAHPSRTSESTETIVSCHDLSRAADSPSRPSHLARRPRLARAPEGVGVVHHHGPRHQLPLQLVLPPAAHLILSYTRVACLIPPRRSTASRPPAAVTRLPGHPSDPRVTEGHAGSLWHGPQAAGHTETPRSSGAASATPARARAPSIRMRAGRRAAQRGAAITSLRAGRQRRALPRSTLTSLRTKRLVCLVCLLGYVSVGRVMCGWAWRAASEGTAISRPNG